MFEYLADYGVILVTGPQRAGTRICARMIAFDLPHRFVDELEIYTDSLYELWQVIHYQRGTPVVVQCPALMYASLYTAAAYPYWSTDGLAVVLVRRPLADIYASEERVGWHWGFVEHVHYHREGRPVAQAKYDWWDDQVTRLRYHRLNVFEVEYESLRDHPLWLPKEQRGQFTALQTEQEAATNEP